MNIFDQKLKDAGKRLPRKPLEILQVNLGKLCNLTCSHCHVEAGPTKTVENMNAETADAVIRFMDRYSVKTLDLTGGAPEMNPNFRRLVKEARRRGVHVIDRSNLTILFEKGEEDLARFLAEQKVEVIASLPCYSYENVDKQRGRGTFDRSISALRVLNMLGYGKERSGLLLNLVYNPVGPHLPPSQEKLEKEYKTNLEEEYGIVFNRLYTITNMPITRYEKFLKAMGEYEKYTELLLANFNLETVEGLMCRNTLSVSWDGKLYDCDFNQALGLAMKNSAGREMNIETLDLDELARTVITTAPHCLGCTAGSGSSCQGALEGTLSD